jgi:hypothetical protein
MRSQVVGRRSGRHVLIAAAGLTLIAGAGIGVVAPAGNSAAISAASVKQSKNIAGQIRATLRIKTSLQASPIEQPGGGTQTPIVGEQKGTFSLTGAVRDTGSLRASSSGGQGSPATLRVDLRGRRGTLRVSVTLSGSAQPGQSTGSAKGSWRITSATGAYARLRGRGQATVSPQLIVLVGAVSST